jgi:hypothetical protein
MSCRGSSEKERVVQTVGFVIISHGPPEQLLRLTRTLTRLYDEPPIAVHHDFGQQALDRSEFARNVSFFHPSIATGWAKWSIVEAALHALGLLYERADPDWFFLLSASDYPVMAPDAVRATLASGGVDAYLDCHHLYAGSGRATYVSAPNPQLPHFVLPVNRRLKLRHYINAHFWLPFPRRRPNGGWRLGRYTVHLPFKAPGLLFSADYGCFYGDQWFTANRAVAKILLEPDPRDIALQRHLRFRSIPDEGYYQSVLCNRSLVISRDNKRFAEWGGGGAHPMQLATAQLPKALASGAFFARKFAPDAPALDELDSLVASSLAPVLT